MSPLLFRAPHSRHARFPWRHPAALAVGRSAAARLGPGAAGHEAAALPDGWQFAPAAAGLGGSAIRAILKVTERPDILSFAGGLPNPAAFPLAAVQAASARVLAADGAAALQYGPTEGYGPLREQVAAYLRRAGQPTTAANVLITTGSQQALDLIGKALLSPGAPLLAANPSYLGALQAFALYQPTVSEIVPGALAESAADGALPAARFCYLTPTFANPTGITLSQAERERLVARLAAARVPLVEDDAYGELWLDGPPPVACRALAPERTLYLGSFSKVLTPGLRVGYVAGPVPVIELLTRLKQAADLHTPSLNQRIVSALIDDGTLAAHLPVLRSLYRVQRDTLQAALERHLRPYAEWQLPAGGMFFWLRLKGGVDAEALLASALQHRVAFVPGAPFHFREPDAATLRLAFSTVPVDLMEEGARRLAAALARGFRLSRCAIDGSRDGGFAPA